MSKLVNLTNLQLLVLAQALDNLPKHHAPTVDWDNDPNFEFLSSTLRDIAAEPEESTVPKMIYGACL